MDESLILPAVRKTAELVVGFHNDRFGGEPEAGLRAAVLEQLDRGGDIDAVWDAVAAQMRGLTSSLAGGCAFEHGTAQWADYVEQDMLLRGWEALYLCRNEPTRASLADVIYAWRMAAQPVLPLESAA